MKVLEKYMELEPHESILNVLEGNAYNTSPNIFARLFGFLERIFSIILGCPRKAHVVVTNRRTIVIEIRKMLWFFDGSVRAAAFTPRSITSIGYVLARSWLIFKSHYLEFHSSASSFIVKSKGGKKPVDDTIKSIMSLAEKVTAK